MQTNKATQDMPTDNDRSLKYLERIMYALLAFASVLLTYSIINGFVSSTDIAHILMRGL